MTTSSSAVARILLLGTLLALSTGAWATDPATTTEYTVILVAKVAGQQVTTRHGNELEVSFEFNDRGRGPKLTSKIVLGEDGLPVRITTEGNDYLKAPVAESYSWQDDVVQWKNTAEEGTAQPETPSFYVSFDSVPEELGILAAALLVAPGGRLPLLPAGEARIERIGELAVSAGGREQTVQQCEIAGLGFTPSTVWLDADRHFFASVGDWLTVIPSGWEEVAATLLDRQRERNTARESQWVRALARRPPALAFLGARLFDAESATTREGMTVLLVGNRIAAVGRDGTITLPEGAEIVDATGKTLLPGLWDMHTHLSALDGPLNIAAGVTSVRDMANDHEQLTALKERFADGRAIGPRVARAGFMDGPGPYAGPTEALVATVEEALGWVEDYAEWGYPQIKIYSSVKPELVPAVAARAHELGMRVSGHIPAGMWAEDAVRQGYDEVTHINMLFLNFYKDVTDTRTPARFIEVAERGADLDFDAPEVRSFLDLLEIRDVVVDPTVTVFESMFTDRPGELSSSYALIADRLPPQVRRSLLAGGLPVGDDKTAERYRASFVRMLDLIAHLHRRGIPLVAGTDGIVGFTLHRELELYVEAGIPAAEVLQIATLGAARVAGKDEELGSIAPGKLADLILVDGDPVHDISAIRRVETVVKDGVVFDSAAVYAAVGVQP